MALNIGQFMTREEVLEGVDDSLWFTTYSRALQGVGEATRGQRWQWARGNVLEVGVSPLVRAFWEETGVELTASCTKLCWELPPRGVFRRREKGTISHAIFFVDDVAVHAPSLDTWGAAMPQATTEVEQYGYSCGQAVDLGPVMLAIQFRVTDKAETYLCAAWALIFEGSILAYNPIRDEAEWVPAHGIANNLSWAEENSAVGLANFVPCVPQEVAHIARLRACCFISWPDDSSLEKEEDGQEEEEEDEQEEEEEPTEVEEQGEASPKPSSGGMELEQSETEQEVEPQRLQRSQEWGSIMDEEEHLTFDDSLSDSNATAGGRSPKRSTPQELGH